MTGSLCSNSNRSANARNAHVESALEAGMVSFTSTSKIDKTYNDTG